MKTFSMDPKMTTIQGVFYPTGYAFIMFPDAENAEKAAQKLETAGFGGQNVMLLTPEVILQEIGKVDGKSTVPLPSVGTEGATVHKYIDLARDGHHALMVKAPSDKDSAAAPDFGGHRSPGSARVEHHAGAVRHPPVGAQPPEHRPAHAREPGFTGHLHNGGRGGSAGGAWSAHAQCLAR